jgi:hypothetical protein
MAAEEGGRRSAHRKEKELTNWIARGSGESSREMRGEGGDLLSGAIGKAEEGKVGSGTVRGRVKADKYLLPTGGDDREGGEGREGSLSVMRMAEGRAAGQGHGENQSRRAREAGLTLYV